MGTNLDHFDEHDDTTLNDALERVSLRGVLAESLEDATERFTLDMEVDDGGSNLSVGQRSLIRLARALIKDVRIMVMDGATAAVDLETDTRIQEAVRDDCNYSKALVCVAHCLRTVISWDKVLVMDAGTMREFDSPLALFDSAEGLFRTMCDQSNITRDDIQRAASVEHL